MICRKPLLEKREEQNRIEKLSQRLSFYRDKLRRITNNFALNYNKIVNQETAGGQDWMCQITPNDGETDGVTLDSNNVSVLNAITFNVTDSFNGENLNFVDIYCNYTGFNQNDDLTPTTNPYGPYGFPDGTWQCTFQREISHFNKTKIFVADADKTIHVGMAESGFLSDEEHTWLEFLYQCWNSTGDCRQTINNINNTTQDIWERLTGTNRNVIVQEDVLSYTLGANNNISINYTIDVPYKNEVPINELLPIRMYFWFTDVSRTQCFDQNKESNTNTAESPSCLPLVAEILGPNNGSVTFQVDLRPNLPAGTYNFTRSIEIDPLGVWTQYGREDIGGIKVLSSGYADIGVFNEEIANYESSSFDESPSSSSANLDSGSLEVTATDSNNDEVIRLNGPTITGSTIGKSLLSGSQIVIIITILNITFIVFIIVSSRTILRLKDKRKH